MDQSQTMALSGITVIDLSRVLAAPYCGQILGDLGAEVIKIERPVSGDLGRYYGTNTLSGADGSRSLESSFHVAANRNKRSVTLELGAPAGRDILLRLLDQADVLIENFKVGTLGRFGLDYPTLREIHPRLVYCSLTGYGQSGPYAQRPGYDPVFQAQSGLMHVTGQREGKPGSEPMKTGPSLIDIVAGMNAAIAILAALHHRHHSGTGQFIDIALLDSAIGVASHSAQEFLMSGKTPPRIGNQGNGGAPSSSFHCADGYVFITAGTSENFAALCNALSLQWMLEEPKYATGRQRFDLHEEVHAAIEAVTMTWKVEDLVELLSTMGVPAGAVNDYGKTFADPQVRHRGVRVDMRHPLSGHVSVVASPLRLADTPPTYRYPPPLLGEHTEAVLSERLGLGPADFERLRAEKVI